MILLFWWVQAGRPRLRTELNSYLLSRRLLTVLEACERHLCLSATVWRSILRTAQRLARHKYTNWYVVCCRVEVCPRSARLPHCLPTPSCRAAVESLKTYHGLDQRALVEVRFGLVMASRIVLCTLRMLSVATVSAE